MNEKLSFELVSPEKLLASGEANIVTLPATEGNIGVMVQHAPVMTGLRNGMVEIEQSDGGNQKFFVKGGFADITPLKVTILAEFSVPENEMDDEMKTLVS